MALICALGFLVRAYPVAQTPKTPLRAEPFPTKSANELRELAPLPLSGTSVPRSPLSEPGSKTGVQTSEEPLLLDLAGALQRARSYNQQFLSAGIAAALAREDRIQAKAALLPTLNAFNQFIYTQGNGTPSGVFVAMTGPSLQRTGCRPCRTVRFRQESGISTSAVGGGCRPGATRHRSPRSGGHRCPKLLWVGDCTAP